jgi:hypothetical protein
MKKTASALTIIMVTTLTFSMAVTYYGSVNHPHLGGKSSSATASPMPTLSPSPITTPTPTPTSSSSSSPTTGASFEGPLGVFGITSPYNETYNSNTLTLEVAGQVIVGSNVELLVTYSLDGQERLPIPIEIGPAHPGDPFIGAFNGSVPLTQLSEGSHSITVFGDLEANGPHLAQATFYFTVNLTSP